MSLVAFDDYAVNQIGAVWVKNGADTSVNRGLNCCCAAGNASGVSAKVKDVSN
jgi:hypothetical protein